MKLGRHSSLRAELNKKAEKGFMATYWTIDQNKIQNIQEENKEALKIEPTFWSILIYYQNIQFE